MRPWPRGKRERDAHVEQRGMDKPASYIVVISVSGGAFWCVDLERDIRAWIDRGGCSRFNTGTETLPTVKTAAMDSSAAILELRWNEVSAPSSREALTKAFE